MAAALLVLFLAVFVGLAVVVRALAVFVSRVGRFVGGFFAGDFFVAGRADPFADRFCPAAFCAGAPSATFPSDTAASRYSASKSASKWPA